MLNSHWSNHSAKPPTTFPITASLSTKKTEKFRAFLIITKLQTAPTLRQKLPPLPPMAGKKPRGPPITSTTQPLSSCHQELPASRRKTEKKQRALSIASTSLPSPSKSQQKTQENIRTFPIEQSPWPAPTRTPTPLSLPHKTEGKPRAQLIGSTPQPLLPSHHESHVSRPKEEENAEPWRIPSIYKSLTKSAEWHPVPECHGQTGNEKQLPVARRDVESRQSSQSAPAAKSKTEDQISRLAARKIVPTALSKAPNKLHKTLQKMSPPTVPRLSALEKMGFCRIWKGRTSDQFLKSIYDGYRESSMIYIFGRVCIKCGRIRREALLKGLGSSFPSRPIMFWSEEGEDEARVPEEVMAAEALERVEIVGDIRGEQLTRLEYSLSYSSVQQFA
ncbi:hypothetical protein HPB51_028033 [Rhipicephalus microplus]|uniref:Uncharacterized protein n=1 Tax=Rhipicephalus microplus TaxID=6941 RepID=A0A9J6CY37_RHIMP|nr:hypothetical protein HPB51_028033 [Rhipicephalus microplus]